MPHICNLPGSYPRWWGPNSEQPDNDVEVRYDRGVVGYGDGDGDGSCPQQSNDDNDDNSGDDDDSKQAPGREPLHP